MKDQAILSKFGDLPMGPVVQRLLSADMDPNVLRPYIADDGRGYITTMERVNGALQAVVRPTNNALLTYDEWKEIDRTVKQIAKLRMRGTADLQRRGLVYNLPNGMATTVLQWQTASDVSDAEIAMAPESSKVKDRTSFAQNYLPLPTVAKELSLNIRFIAQGRRLQQPLDTLEVAQATRKVAEKVESILFTGASTYTFGGGTIYGYQDFPSRSTRTLATQWTASAATGATVVDDVNAMIQLSVSSRHYGPWAVYVPTGYETVLNEDYSTQYGKTIRERLLQIAGLEEVNVSDYLTAHNVVLVEMSPETVQMVEGLPIQTVQWDEQGGMVSNYMVMTIMIPRLIADKDGRSGIVHLS